jgi:hypothetical protein
MQMMIWRDESSHVPFLNRRFGKSSCSNRFVGTPEAVNGIWDHLSSMFPCCWTCLLCRTQKFISKQPLVSTVGKLSVNLDSSQYLSWCCINWYFFFFLSQFFSTLRGDQKIFLANFDSVSLRDIFFMKLTGSCAEYCSKLLYLLIILAIEMNEQVT